MVQHTLTDTEERSNSNYIKKFSSYDKENTLSHQYRIKVKDAGEYEKLLTYKQHCDLKD
jgi:hypothetical protein